jgi:hypothetical protein
MSRSHHRSCGRSTSPAKTGRVWGRDFKGVWRRKEVAKPALHVIDALEARMLLSDSAVMGRYIFYNNSYFDTGPVE